MCMLEEDFKSLLGNYLTENLKMGIFALICYYTIS